MELYTAQFRYSGEDRIDTTVKSGNKVFAPSWDMVMGVKNSSLSKEDYTKMYIDKMRHSYINNREEWNKLLNMKSCTIVCYCGYKNKISGEIIFCHRHILAELLVKLGAEYIGERVDYNK